MRKIAILGAGISGLTAAWYLQKQFGNTVSLTLFEKEERLGGWIRSSQNGEYFFESGPRALRAQDCQEVLELIHELNLQGDLLEADPAARCRYLYHQGKLEPIPASLRGYFRSPLSKGCFRAILRDLISAKSSSSDESIHAFFARRFSSGIAEQWIDPLVKGIYAGDPKQLSMRACFPILWELESCYSSLLWGAFRQSLSKKKKPASQGLITLKKGLETIIVEIAKRLDHPLYLGVKAEKITFSPERAYLHCNGTILGFDMIISTIPAHRLAKLIDDPGMQTDLREIPFASVGVVHLGYADNVHPYKGFGYLVPEREQQKVLGVIFDSAVFPQQNQSKDQTRLTVMLGGTSHPETIEGGDDRCCELAQKVVERHLGIQKRPAFMCASIAHQAIPQYPVGFLSLLERIRHGAGKYPRLRLLGTSYGGVSLNYAVASAKKMVGSLSKNGIWHQNCI